MSAAPKRSPRSEGLSGEASIRTITSFGAGGNTSTSASDTSSSPFFLIKERSCRPVIGNDSAMTIPPFEQRIFIGQVECQSQQCQAIRPTSTGYDRSPSGRYPSGRGPGPYSSYHQPPTPGPGQAICPVPKTIAAMIRFNPEARYCCASGLRIDDADLQ